MTPTSKHTYRVTANVFGVPFGFCGLAQFWTTAHAVAGTPRWPADTLWIVTAAWASPWPATPVQPVSSSSVSLWR